MVKLLGGGISRPNGERRGGGRWSFKTSFKRGLGIGTRNSRPMVMMMAGDGQDDLDDLLQEDLQRMAARKNALDDATQRRVDYSGEEDRGSPVKDVVDKVLIADFFFVLFALGWFGVGVGVKTSSGNSGVLDAWLSLWQWVFQPAIGVLMLGALASGTIGWIKKKMQ